MPGKTPVFKRVLLKVSGDGFCKPGEYGMDPEEVASIAAQARDVQQLGVELAIVVGGGNMVRGNRMSASGVNRVTADHMGMLSTVINALSLQDALEQMGTETRLLTAIEMADLAEPFIRRRAIRHLEKKRVVILAGGTGNPYFTTDTAAALRAMEIGAEVLLKATKVDGIYTDDPLKNPDAVQFDRLKYLDIINKNLKIMDVTAISLCMDNKLRIIVFNLKKPGNIQRAVVGDHVGTRVGDFGDDD